MAGYKSLFAFWAGGAGSVTPTTSGGKRSMLAPWMGGASASAVVTNGGYRSMLAFWSGGAFGYEGVTTITTTHGGGWGKDLYTGAGKKKTLKQLKKDYYSLTEFEIKEEVAEIEATVKQARKDIEFNQDLGLADVIARIKAFIAIEKVKLIALAQVEQEKFKRKKLDMDLAFIAAFLMNEDEDE